MKLFNNTTTFKDIFPKFDSKKMENGKFNDEMEVFFYLFHDLNPVSAETLSYAQETGINSDKCKQLSDVYKEVCYSKLPDLLSINNKKPSPNRLFSCFKKATKSTPNLSDEDILNWFEISKQAGFLPTYIGPEFAIRKTLILDLESASATDIFIWLSIARFARENASIVKSMLHLVQELYISYPIALVISLSNCLQSQLHSFVDFSCGYLDKGKIDDKKYSTLWTWIFYHWSNKHPVFKDKPCTEIPPLKGWHIAYSLIKKTIGTKDIQSRSISAVQITSKSFLEMLKETEYKKYNDSIKEI